MSEIDPRYQEDLTNYTYDYIELFKNQFTKLECDTIIKECQKVCDHYNRMTKTMSSRPNSVVDDISGMVSPKLKHNMDPQLEEKILAKVHGCYESYARKHFILQDMEHLYTRSFKYHHVRPGGGYHDWHTENMNTGTIERQMVFHIALNTTGDEGALEFLNWKRKVKPVRGNIVLWPASWTHVHRGDAMKTMHKHYITGWLTYSGKGTFKEARLKK